MVAAYRAGVHAIKRAVRFGIRDELFMPRSASENGPGLFLKRNNFKFWFELLEVSTICRKIDTVFNQK